MRYGAVVPNTELGADTAAVLSWAAGVEAEGFTAVVAWDHVVGAQHAGRVPPITRDYDEYTPFREPLTLLAYLAGRTSTVELVTGVIVLPQRQTVLVAKQAAEVDLLSGGRLVLGVGNGWNLVEYDVLGAEFAGRGERLAEGVEVMRQLWTQELVDFRGSHHRLDRVAIAPRPARPIPVLFGGASTAAVTRAARLGDGYLFGAPTAVTRQHRKVLEEQLDVLGRDRASFRVDLQVHAATPREDLVRQLADWLPDQVDDVYISTMPSPALGATVEVARSAEAHLQLACAARELLRSEFGG